MTASNFKKTVKAALKNGLNRFKLSKNSGESPKENLIASAFSAKFVHKPIIQKVNPKKLNILATLLVFTMENAIANDYSVFCFQEKSDTWYWLDDSITVAGNFKRSPLNDKGEYFLFLDISFETYKKLLFLCNQTAYPQPAKGYLSNWAVFRVIKGQEFFYAKGKKSYYKINSNNHTFLHFSDAQLKKEIQPIIPSIETLNQIKGYHYRKRETNHYEYGFLAQEIEGYFPDLVKLSPNGYKQVDYRGIIPILLEEIKALHQRVSLLEQQD